MKKYKLEIICNDERVSHMITMKDFVKLKKNINKKYNGFVVLNKVLVNVNIIKFIRLIDEDVEKERIKLIGAL